MTHGEKFEMIKTDISWTPLAVNLAIVPAMSYELFEHLAGSRIFMVMRAVDWERWNDGKFSYVLRRSGNPGDSDDPKNAVSFSILRKANESIPPGPATVYEFLRNVSPQDLRAAIIGGRPYLPALLASAGVLEPADNAAAVIDEASTPIEVVRFEGGFLALYPAENQDACPGPDYDLILQIQADQTSELYRPVRAKVIANAIGSSESALYAGLAKNMDLLGVISGTNPRVNALVEQFQLSGLCSPPAQAPITRRARRL